MARACMGIAITCNLPQRCQASFVPGFIPLWRVAPAWLEDHCGMSLFKQGTNAPHRPSQIPRSPSCRCRRYPQSSACVGPFTFENMSLYSLDHGSKYLTISFCSWVMGFNAIGGLVLRQPNLQNAWANAVNRLAGRRLLQQGVDKPENLRVPLSTLHTPRGPC